MSDNRITIKGSPELKAKLKGLSDALRTKLGAAAKRGAVKVQKKAWENITEKFQRGTHRTGDLKNYIKAEQTSQVAAVVGTDLVYAAIHEFGGTIVPRTAKALVFQTRDGNWVRTQKVRIPKRPYLYPAADSERDKIIAEFTELIETELEKVST